MPLSRKEIAGLMRLVANTQESEIDCERCLAVVAEFAEQQLLGKTMSEGLKAVEQHLSICDECRKEYEALRRAVKGCQPLRSFWLPFSFGPVALRNTGFSLGKPLSKCDPRSAAIARGPLCRHLP